jgi:tRNA uridine 5-carbamoylmethylation protein Kti12
MGPTAREPSLSKPTLIAMKGLPRSGKSTIVADLSDAFQAPIVRRDAIRLALHGLRFKAEAEPMVKAMSLYMIRALFLAGHEHVICDETNFSRAARKSLESPEWDILYYEVNTSPDVCKERAIATGQPDLIPVIDEMWSRHEPLDDTEQRFPQSGL